MSSPDEASLDAKNSIQTPLKKHQKRVMCFGTFDIFHAGHVFYLSEAQKLGDELIVVIARDHRVSSGKGRDPVQNEQVRQKIVAEHFRNARVVLGDEHDIFAPIRTFTPEILAFGYDQKVPEAIIREMFPDIEIVRLAGFETDKYKSSILREQTYAKKYE